MPMLDLDINNNPQCFLQHPPSWTLPSDDDNPVLCDGDDAWWVKWVPIPVLCTLQQAFQVPRCWHWCGNQTTNDDSRHSLLSIGEHAHPNLPNLTHQQTMTHNDIPPWPPAPTNSHNSTNTGTWTAAPHPTNTNANDNNDHHHKGPTAHQYPQDEQQWHAMTTTQHDDTSMMRTNDEKPDAREMRNVRCARWTDAWTPKQTHTHTQP